ncbi:CPBP family intramembrane metalloprotease [bacterium]|nr:CPBP family intramembrane metalloprotease [bacterium]
MNRSLFWVIRQHLVPGILAFFFYGFAARFFKPRGLPDSFALFLTMPIILIPYELGVLIHAKKNDTGAMPENVLIPYKNRLSVLQYAAIVLPLLVWMFFCFFIIGPHEQHFIIGRFPFLSLDWLVGSGGSSSYSKNALIATWVFGLAVNGLALPFVEELYFHGYLLPRIPLSGIGAPVLNTILFSLYHFFSPCQNLTRIVAIAPMVYMVWRKKSVYIGIMTHCLLNTLAMLLTLPAILK